MIRLLLIQLRDWDNPMAEHEHACVERRFGDRPVKVTSRNAKTHIAAPEWLDDQDAFVIGGSGRYSVHDPRSTRFVYPLRDLLERGLSEDIPGFGICFGHQLLGLHLGARVVTDEKRTECGTIALELTEIGRVDPLFGPLGERFDGHTGHTDCVLEVPDTVQLLARSGTLETQAFKVEGKRFYSTQFHPDLTAVEAQARYRSVAADVGPFDSVSEEEHVGGFVPNRDDTESLLGRFLDLYF